MAQIAFREYSWELPGVCQVGCNLLGKQTPPQWPKSENKHD